MNEDWPGPTSRFERAMEDVHQTKTDIEVMKAKLTVISDDMKKLVTRPEFTPVKLLAYGMAGSLLAGVLAAILSLVLHR